LKNWGKPWKTWNWVERFSSLRITITIFILAFLTAILIWHLIRNFIHYTLQIALRNYRKSPASRWRCPRKFHAQKTYNTL
jgi:hypothetical protein